MNTAATTAVAQQPSPIDFLRQAREGLGLAARLLEYPNAAGLDNARQCLQVVVTQLQTCHAMVGGRTQMPAFDEALGQIAAEFAHVNAMFREAGTLYGGWKRVLSARLGGYTRNGRPAPLRCARQVAMNI